MKIEDLVKLGNLKFKKKRTTKRFVIPWSWLPLAEGADVPFWESVVDWLDSHGLEHNIENVKIAIVAQREKEK